MSERFDYQRQQDDEERQQTFEPDSYWLSEMKRLKAYNEAWDKWSNQWPSSSSK